MGTQGIGANVFIYTSAPKVSPISDVYLALKSLKFGSISCPHESSTPS